MARSLTANMLDAKTRLSSLVDLVEKAEVDEVVIARGGRPAARLVPLARKGRVRLGLAKGRICMPESTDASDADVLALFERGDAPAP
jgi:antitoxin (DNA-binding transcriptional repressor) of toxin-antitoxin stability system